MRLFITPWIILILYLKLIFLNNSLGCVFQILFIQTNYQFIQLFFQFLIKFIFLTFLLQSKLVLFYEVFGGFWLFFGFGLRFGIAGLHVVYDYGLWGYHNALILSLTLIILLRELMLIMILWKIITRSFRNRIPMRVILPKFKLILWTF